MRTKHALHYELYVSSLTRIDLDDAEEAAEQVIVAFSDNPGMYLMHASVMGSQASDSIFGALGYAKKALHSLNRAVELEPGDPRYLNVVLFDGSVYRGWRYRQSAITC
jgi:hypothetical protein